MRLSGGARSSSKVPLTRGHYGYINRSPDKGGRVGDRFSVVRPDKDPTDVPGFKWQTKLLRAMGTPYMDLRQIRVVSVQPKVSVAQVSFSCGFMQRGDILEPYQDRPAAPFKDSASFDHFAPISGKPVAMLVAGKDQRPVFSILTPRSPNIGPQTAA